MLNQRTEIMRHRNKYALVITIAWTGTSDVKLKFLEIFGACGHLIYCSCEADFNKFHE